MITKRNWYEDPFLISDEMPIVPQIIALPKKVEFVE